MDRREAIKKTAFLLGSTISASAIAGVLNGCQPTGKADWQPQTLSLAEAKLTGEIAERILPASDTLGAKDLFVDEFIDLMLANCYNQKTVNQFKVGLEQVNVATTSVYGKPFMQCNASQQEETIRQMEETVQAFLQKASPGAAEKPFFLLFKELTLLGYFTSEYVMTELINFNPVPGAYKGCIDIDENTLVAVDLNV